MTKAEWRAVSEGIRLLWAPLGVKGTHGDACPEGRREEGRPWVVREGLSAQQMHQVPSVASQSIPVPLPSTQGRGLSHLRGP